MLVGEKIGEFSYLDYLGRKLKRMAYKSRLTVVSREAKKKQHACASSDPRDHYSEYLHGWQL